MQRAISDDAFFLAPAGKYLVAPGIAYWCMHPRLWGVTICGTADEGTARELMRWMDREHERDYGRYQTLFDMRRCRAISARAFGEFGAFAYHNRMRQSGRVDRGVVVRPPDGMFAAAVEGSVAIFRQRVRWDVVDSLDRALAALGERDPEHEIDALIDDLERVGSTREALHDLWERDASLGSPSGAARRLGISVRSLQRRLREQGTTFEHELRRARVRRAQKLLAETDLKLAAIALDAGFATPAHFSKVFRDETGESPSDWRERVRASGARA